jgi:hypothetical protein
MEALSQLDVQNPDHVSVITRDGKLTVSVIKDGASVTLGFPVKMPWSSTSPKPLQQQSLPETKAVQVPGNVRLLTKKVRRSPIGNAKLTFAFAKEIKAMLADPTVMTAFRSKQQAYETIGKKFNVSYHTISNIHKGLAWRTA